MDNKDALVLNIGKDIKKHRELETKDYIKNIAVALANVNFFGGQKKLWLTNSPNLGGFKSINDIHGSVVGTSKGIQSTLTKDDGITIYKNSKIGGVIISNSSGKYSVETPSGISLLEILNKSSFVPNPHTADAEDIQMNIGERKPRFYRKLSDLLEQINQSDDFINELNEEKDSFEKEKLSQEQSLKIKSLISQIENEEFERKNILEKAQTFIRKNAELRHQPILDPWQEEIKRSHIFNATIAIDGGPGTGKTTSLIQRIKFLIDKVAMADYLPNLTKEKKDKLFNEQSNWVFFSPNELLKLFLKNNMTSEGLIADDKRVLVWEDYKGVIIKKYKLLNSETQNPFLILRKYKQVDILPSDKKSLKKILDSFENFYLEFHNNRLKKLVEIDLESFIWKDRGLSIQNFIKRQEKDYSIEGLIRLYFNIQDNFSEEVKVISKEFNDLLKNATAKILSSIEEKPEVNNTFYVLIEKWTKDNNQEGQDIDDDDDNDILLDDSTSIRAQLFSNIRSLIRKKALRVYDKTVKLSKKDKDLAEMIDTVIDIKSLASYDKIGQLAYFAKYYERSVKGIASNLISEIPTLYKKFRKEEFSNQKNKWDYKILEHILLKEESKNKRIHSNEQSFLIHFINDIIKKSYKVSKSKSKKINHPYFTAFNEVSRPVIGVDEATDFHLIDLLAIHSLSDYEISSVTYSGDIMQRLTSGGIRNWDEMKSFVKNFEEKKLMVSYRQSPTLLDVASTIYNKATGNEAEYISFMDKDEKEPKPLYFIDNDEEERIDWISKRILEIYKAYGNSIPSIAIFLSEEEKIEGFAHKLGEIDRLADVDIKVKASNNGRVLGDANTVRVFSIQHIKGLEFEAVFFHNINEVFNATSKELVLKNLYVGLSRASFYLGVTSAQKSEELSFLDEVFETDKLNWQIR